MRSLLRLTRLTLIFATVATASSALLSGCASTGAAANAAPVELNGTRWKLLIAGGVPDGRVIQFKKQGKDGYVGTLAELGRRLNSTVGIQVGREIFSLRQVAPTDFRGVYTNVTPDGDIVPQEVEVFVNGDSLTWNLESATWEKVQ